MIAVIADDLTGAAELGGVGLRHGLQVEIALSVPAATAAGLFVIATDTRSKPVQQAAEEMALLSARLLHLEPALLFKKIDSVLRGHVLAEVKAQLEVLGLRKALIIPANPHLGRTIVEGTYYFHGKPIHTTSFSHDPEFAITDAAIPAMLRSGSTPVHILKHTDPLPEQGIVVGEVKGEEDLKAWAALAAPATLLVGASGFFSALLNKHLGQATQVTAEAPPLCRPALYVSGSTFHTSRAAIKEEYEKGGPVSYVPAAIIEGNAPPEPLFEKWADSILAHVQAHAKGIVAIDPATTAGKSITAAQLRMITARITERVLQRMPVCELFVEGGATAWAVLEQASLGPLQPVQELAPGVVRMRAGNKSGLYLTIKPGSYDWPAAVLQFIYHT